jgi:exonuclease SbcD
MSGAGATVVGSHHQPNGRVVPDSVTIVHAADIHLDSPLRGLGRLRDKNLVSDLRNATRLAFQNLVELVVKRKADALVLAGDLYDGDSEDYATARFFVEQMSILNDAQIPVFMVAGNHDAASVITKALTLPDNVTAFSTAKPQTVVREDLGLAVHGQGFATKAVVQNLARNYPEPVAGMVNVGVLHTSVAGYSGHDPYAPCSVADLQSKGYEYFALGHIHARQVLCTDATTAAFSGNLQGRHVRETGAKGAYVVTLEPGESADLEFVELDVARWEHITIDVTPFEDLESVLAGVRGALTSKRQEASGKPLVARLTLSGSSKAAYQLADSVRVTTELEILANDLDVALEKIRNRSRAPEASLGLDERHRDALARIASSESFNTDHFKSLLGKIQSDTDRPLRDLDIADETDDEELPDLALEQLLAAFGVER